jgi:hypothetical protein
MIYLLGFCFFQFCLIRAGIHYSPSRLIGVQFPQPAVDLDEAEKVLAVDNGVMPIQKGRHVATVIYIGIEAVRAFDPSGPVRDLNVRVHDDPPFLMRWRSRRQAGPRNPLAYAPSSG